MKIISIRQPFAQLIVTGAKDVENRTWPTTYRGPVLIHASLKPDAITEREIGWRFGVRWPAEQPLGAVVGVAEIVDCTQDHPSRWYVPGHWAFVLANARRFVTPVRWTGALGLRSAPAELLTLCGLADPVI